MKFAFPYYFLGLGVIVFLGFIFLWDDALRKKGLQKWIHLKMWKTLLPTYLPQARWKKSLFLLAALVCFLFAAALLLQHWAHTELPLYQDFPNCRSAFF